LLLDAFLSLCLRVTGKHRGTGELEDDTPHSRLLPTWNQFTVDPTASRRTNQSPGSTQQDVFHRRSPQSCGSCRVHRQHKRKPQYL